MAKLQAQKTRQALPVASGALAGGRSNPAMMRQQKVNDHMVLAERAPNLL